jgi:uncharacterized coiled-coil DUF342 family protein
VEENMTSETDPTMWQWIVENLWVPLAALVLSLVSLVRHGDLNRIKNLEESLKTTASKADLFRVEVVAVKAVQDERFREYMSMVETARIEARDQVNAQFTELKRLHEILTERVQQLTERVVSHGYAADQRTHRRGDPPNRG